MVVASSDTDARAEGLHRGPQVPGLAFGLSQQLRCAVSHLVATVRSSTLLAGQTTTNCNPVRWDATGCDGRHHPRNA